jgi:small ubiquitin-related modifier
MSDSDICSDDEKYGGMGSAMANSLHRHSGHFARSRDQAFPAPGTQVAALTVVRAAEENKQIIMIHVKDQTGEETMFKMYNSTKMSKVFRAYEKNKVVEKASLCFLFKGKIILEMDTPKMLKLNDNDQINCVLATAVAEGGMGRKTCTTINHNNLCIAGVCAWAM